MSEHYINKCSCGKTISQCRCSSPDKKITVTPNGCDECKSKSMKTLEQLQAEFGKRLVTLNSGGPGILASLHVTAKQLDGAAPVVSFVASDGSIDRYEEVILPSAWGDLKNFRKNPVITDCHNYSSVGFILGKAIRCEVKNGVLEDDVEFAVSNPLGKIGYDLARQGFCPTQSVGFMPEEWTNGDAPGKPCRTYSKCDLLEIALTVVPANPNASNIKKAVDEGAVLKSDVIEAAKWLAQFCSEQADPKRPAGASAFGVHEARALQTFRGLRDVLK